MTEVFATLITTITATVAHFDKLYLAYSGGLDSHVLLYLLSHSEIVRSKITVVHINHGLSAYASAWQQHCHSTCDTLQLDCVSYNLPLRALAQHNVEAVARQGRYDIFRKLLIQPSSCLLMAHHQNDQAETLLLQLFRGAGIDGLAAMPVMGNLAYGNIYRPLLDITRQQLHSFALAHHLQWVEDDSNSELRFERNWLRERILPLLQQRQPAIIRNLARSAVLCAQAKQTLDTSMASQLTTIQDSSGRLNITLLRNFPEATQAQLVRLWLKKHGFLMPSRAKLQQILSHVLTARDDAKAHVSFQGCEVRKYRNLLYAMAPLTPCANIKITWHHFPNPLVLPQLAGVLTATPTDGGIAIAAQQLLEVRYRTGGEKMRLAGRSKQQHSLKKLFQEWGVPPWLRQRIPLIYFNETLLAVVGYAYAVTEQHTSLPTWEISL